MIRGTLPWSFTIFIRPVFAEDEARPEADDAESDAEPDAQPEEQGEQDGIVRVEHLEEHGVNTQKRSK